MRGFRLRPLLLLVHRYAGLGMAGFLLVASLTGMLLAWNAELERWISPELFLAPAPSSSAVAVDPLLLRDKVLAAYPNAQAAFQPLKIGPGLALQFFLTPRMGADGKPLPLLDNQVFVDPYSAAILGSRNGNDVWQGRKALMPFIYRLHYTLTLGAPGAWVFGVVALIWTIDCVVGFYLTLPARARSANPRPWHVRWWPAWKIRRGAGFHKLNVDSHRAGGLWLWPLLFVIALSSVALSLPVVYTPVMRVVFAHQPDDKSLPRLAQPLPHPAIDWAAARAIGRRAMAGQAARLHFDVIAEDWMFYDAGRGIYRYTVSSSRDIRDFYVSSTLYIDAKRGEVLGIWLPTGEAAGDTITTWLTSLHMGAVGGVPYKVLLSLFGVMVVILSVTGIYLWWKKRLARMHAG